MTPNHLDETFKGPWFNSRTAAAYVPCRSLKSWYLWRDRHGIIPRANGSVAKRDIDRALRIPRKRFTPSPASLANLSKRKVA